MTYVLYGLIAFVISIIAHKIAQRIFPTLGLLDFPERYNLRRMPIPYPTGVITVALFICFTAFRANTVQNIGILIGVSILAIFSFIDDRKQLSSTMRIWLHILIGIIIYVTGTRILEITNPVMLDGNINIGTIAGISAVLTIFWLMLTINAVNWFDGIPGQVQCIATLGFTVIGILALSDRITYSNPEQQIQLAKIAFFLAGLSLAGILFDLPVPKVIIGDTGAMFYGLMLGILTIYSGGKVATAFLVLGVPLLDSLIVIIRRIARKKKPWQGNAFDEHLHHRLLRSGWRPGAIITLFTLIGGTFGVSALYMSTIEKIIAALLMLVVMIILTIYTEVMLRMQHYKV